MRIFRRRRPRWCLLAGLFLTIVMISLCSTTNIIRDIGYITRPIWDKHEVSFTVLPHYVVPEPNNYEHLCKLHGWSLAPASTAKVYDAVIFSIELDMLEIRLHELWDVVDKFVIIEADRTFTGKEKDLYFQQNRDRFAFAENKIHYENISLPALEAGKDPMDQEIEMRRQMIDILQKVGLRKGDFLIVADVDEIPRKEAINLVKHCTGYPESIHLELKNYLYSFEFPTGDTIWRAKIRQVDDVENSYRRAKTSDILLADAGWHCSFCFRYLDDFIFKMTSYSHADRVTNDKLLDLKELQKKICSGKDIFDMYPEAYSYADFLRLLHGVRKTSSMVDIPAPIVNDPVKFGFLLPGGCQRQNGSA